jgi:LacI family repressor for deo operon, udp, cdd, tsx, nupC, and nupG
MAKIKDVAIQAGVSTATVSRILSNPDWGKAETRANVMAAVEKLHYKPNALARQLRTQETHTIIVIVPNLYNDLFHKIIYGIETEAAQNGYHILIADTHGQMSIEKYYLNAIQQRQVDGIISMSATAAQHLVERVATHYPLVLALQNYENCSIPSVGIDNVEAAASVTRHLIKMGHTHIAHITSSSDLLLYRERLKGYKAALSDKRISIEDSLIRSGEDSMQGGFEQMNALLASGQTFTAVTAAGDTMAIGVIAALKAHGLKVPEDIAVTGFDDIAIASYYNPTLTTVRQPAEQMGQFAFRKLLNVMKDNEITESSTILPFELVVRESCGHLL